MTTTELQGLAFTPTDKAVEIICDSIGADPVQLLRRTEWGTLTRGPVVSAQRALVWAMMRQVMRYGEPRWSYPDIAAYFGVAHSSVSEAVRKLSTT